MNQQRNGIHTIIENQADSQLRVIGQKILDEERLTREDGLYLFENADLNYTGALANYIREKLHGDKTYFNRNFHIEPTNVCIFTCDFLLLFQII